MGAESELRAALRDAPDAIVAAFGPGGRLVPVPQSVPLSGQHEFGAPSGLELVVPEDQPAVIEAWTRAQTEALVCISARLLADPEHPATIRLFDVRAEHGVHVLVAECGDLDVVLRSGEIRASLRRRVARVKKDGLAVFLEVDEATTALLGWRADELVGRSTADFVHPDDRQRAIDNWLEMRSEAGARRVRLRMRHARGDHVWIEVVNDNHLDDPAVGCVLSEMVDISEEMSTLEALHDRERLLARLAEALPIGICQLRANREVAYANQPLLDLLGPVESVDTLLRAVNELDRPLVANAVDRAFDGIASTVEVALGRTLERRCEFTLRVMYGDDGRRDGVVVCTADVTDRSRLRDELEHRANHDPLTDCLNRTATEIAVDRLLRETPTVVVAFIDLDGFKNVNDQIGHAAGDELLRVAARRLRSVLRAGDVLGRFGGDEFVVVCRGHRDGSVAPDALAGRLRSAMNGDVVFGGQRIPMRASIGVVVSNEGELDMESLLQRADTAMYESKRASRVS